MADTNTGIDDNTFVNMAVTWTLMDLQILDPITLDEQEHIMFTDIESLTVYKKNKFFLFSLNDTIILFLSKN